MCVCVCLSWFVLFLNKSGTEEDYTEFQQLLEDISEYNNDFWAGREEEQKSALQKKVADKKKGRR